MRKTTFTMMLLLAIIFAKAQPGSITNITATQRTDGSAMVDINFDLSGPALYYMSMEVSFNNGASYWPISASAISGNIQISAGTGYHIVWDAVQSHPNRFSDQSKIMLVANAASTFNPCPDTPIVTDSDGNVYNTVLIETQCWMKENLRTTKFRNGFSIGTWQLWYNDDISYKYQYGGLYNWYAVDSEHGLCPEGWHVPTRAEWDILVNFVPQGALTSHLKSCRQVGTPMGDDCDTEEHPRWDQHASVYGNDGFGFSALPGGKKLPGTASEGLGVYGRWWTSTTYLSGYAYRRHINNSTHTIWDWWDLQSDFYSVRCIKTGE